MLPERFLDRMKSLLGEEYTDFLTCYDRPGHQSLRVNLLKGQEKDLAEKVNFLKEAVPWAKGGYYYRSEDKPGRHPFHEAGVYYIQEASAMAPAELLKAQPGEKVLDLCAAPGGKSTQIAADMQGQGILICNEINPQRAKILSENIERMGISNALVLNHEPAHLAERFLEYFDKILVDAPCSGEGMFRKNEEAAKEWSLANVQMCAKRQENILESAALMLKPGGRMVYSTCTFAPEEDEGVIGNFLRSHPEFSLEDGKMASGLSDGVREFRGTIRLWPHKLEGEGHFLACLKKEGTCKEKLKNSKEEKKISVLELKEWEEFTEKYLKRSFTGTFLKFGEQLYLAPEGLPALKGLKVLRPGLHLGTVKKKRFEPAHGLALFLHPGEVTYERQLSMQEAQAYLNGQTIPAFGEKGWYLATIDGYSLGWGKVSGSVMKNHYPRGLRIML